MKCFRCSAHAPTSTLYRVNAKGRPPVWACFDHRIEPDMELDMTIEELERHRRGHAQVLAIRQPSTDAEGGSNG